jgi:hypothetical protein
MLDITIPRNVSRIADGAPVALVVSDNTAAHWATYFLRDIKLRLVALYFT